jgi:hypothetical protein
MHFFATRAVAKGWAEGRAVAILSIEEGSRLAQKHWVERAFPQG